MNIKDDERLDQTGLSLMNFDVRSHLTLCWLVVHYNCCRLRSHVVQPASNSPPQGTHGTEYNLLVRGATLLD